MKRIGLLLFTAFAAWLVFWQATLTQRAVRVVDEGTRLLGETSHEPIPRGPVYFENDSYYWLLMAEQMREEGLLRVRWTESDNAPFGRPVYWSQSIAWLINLVSFMPGISGQEDALAAASFWVNPLIETLTIFLLVCLLAPLGTPMVLLTIALFLALGDVAWAFSSLRPDHQSLQAAFTVITTAALLRTGFGFGPPSLGGNTEDAHSHNKAGPRLFVLAGASVGMSLWVSAAATMPYVIILTASVAAALLFHVPHHAHAAARGWTAFGLSAGVVSLFFWLVEFFPALGATRLEVNNPGFSLWVAGVGVALAMAFRLRGGTQNNHALLLACLLGAGVVCALMPAVILFGPAAWYQPRNLYMDRFHNFILEFYTYHNFTKGRVVETLLKSLQSVLPLAACALLPVFFAKQSRTRAALLALLLLTTGLFLLSMRQIRWFAIFAPMLAMTAAAAASWLCGILWRGKIGSRAVAVALFALVIAQGVVLAYGQLKTLSDVASGRSVLKEVIPAVLNKRVASSLATARARPSAVLADPSIAPAIAYFARIPVVVSFYWENLDGVRDATLFFADRDGTEALRIARKRKFSHIIVPSGPLLPNYFDFITHGHYDTERAKTTLASKLTEGSALSLPPWLEVDPELDRISKTPYVYRGEVLEQYLNAYRVEPEKAPDNQDRRMAPTAR